LAGKAGGGTVVGHSSVCGTGKAGGIATERLELAATTVWKGRRRRNSKTDSNFRKEGIPEQAENPASEERPGAQL
jgi:hypothetical protein